jgi:hypothetical protein
MIDAQLEQAVEPLEVAEQPEPRAIDPRDDVARARRSRSFASQSANSRV